MVFSFTLKFDEENLASLTLQCDLMVLQNGFYAPPVCIALLHKMPEHIHDKARHKQITELILIITDSKS